MRIAVDFDGTLSLGKWPGAGPANEKMVKYVKERQKMGDKLILWTCREDEDLQTAIKWCEEQGIIFDAINDNLPEVKEFWDGNSRKVGADLYIDDKSAFKNVYRKYPVESRKFLTFINKVFKKKH